jgi:hypothetical protein
MLKKEIALSRTKWRKTPLSVPPNGGKLWISLQIVLQLRRSEIFVAPVFNPGKIGNGEFSSARKQRKLRFHGFGRNGTNEI